MNRIKDYSLLKLRIVDWIHDYVTRNHVSGLVVGVSGGIDSAVSSTLAAHTGLPVHALGMPLHQNKDQENLSDVHLEWLDFNFSNVTVEKFDLSEVFDVFKSTMGSYGEDKLALANSRARLRMTTLYQVAGAVGGLVVGTGNKVEDYGVGFFTKYGDGAVDIAPIADLYKSEVWELGEYLEVDQEIVDAPPTDGLWDDQRTDEDQLGATYEQLEEAMENGTGPGVDVLNYYNQKNQHKMSPIPTFKL